MTADRDDRRARAARPRPLRQWLRTETTTLGRIGGHARNLARLQRQLQSQLPDTLAGHWQLAGLRADAVMLIAGTPAWASRLRFHQTQIIDAVQDLTGVRPRQCRIAVDPPRLAPRRPPRPPIGAEAGEHLARFAESQADERLRASLRRLAAHVRGRPDEGEDEDEERR